jgi:chromosome segregation ATPase
MEGKASMADETMDNLREQLTSCEEELEAALSDNDELFSRIGEMEDTIAELRMELRDLASRLAEHFTPDGEKLYGGTD